MSRVNRHVNFKDGLGRLRPGTITVDNTDHVDIRIGHHSETYTNVRNALGKTYWEDSRYRGTLGITFGASGAITVTS